MGLIAQQKFQFEELSGKCEFSSHMLSILLQIISSKNTIPKKNREKAI